MFFNKKYNSIYGKCLRKLLEANNEKYFATELLQSFIHSFIHWVNYDQIVNELWETDLTKDDKKKIGNITTPHRSYGFTL